VAARETKAPDRAGRELPLLSPKEERRGREARRLATLDGRIAALAGKKKKRPATGKVLAMLMKSRSTCPVQVRPEDRLHFRVLLVDDRGEGGGVEEKVMHFSRTAAVGRAADLASPGEEGRREVLVKREGGFRRLPALGRLHEAVERGWLAEFGELVVRRIGEEDGGTEGIEGGEN
jgi:hypothetical protein